MQRVGFDQFSVCSIKSLNCMLLTTYISLYITIVKQECVREL